MTISAKIELSDDGKAKVVTGKVRLAYVTLIEPKAQEEGKKPKYSTSVIIDGADEETLAAIRKAVKHVADVGFKGKAPKVFKQPLRDGNEKGDEAFEDNMFFNCSSLRKPPCANLEGQIDASQIKSGDYARVSVSFYFYDTGTSKGVAAGLNAVQFLEEGEALGKGGGNALNDFGLKNDFGV